MQRFTILACLLLLCGCVNDDKILEEKTIANLTSGTNEINVNQIIDGVLVPRTVYVQTPQNFNASQTYPLVFVFHGSGGTGSQFLNQSTLNELINSGAFIGVYPNGHSNDGSKGGYWNLGSEATSADDVEFVNLIVQQLEGHTEANTSKMYALGFSNGAGMVNVLGKSTPHFKAIAPLFSQQSISTGNLAPLSTLSVFQVNGAIDNLIPIQGGTSPVGEFMSAQNSALNWANSYNCGQTAVQANHNWGGISLESFSYSNCDTNAEVVYFIAANVGHGWANQQTDSIAFEEIWSFFESK
ncbi:alpha/beta hydrolase family esterase [Croceitalea rosinachiae]|uniref:PHB depolymerase family esterase n=1 Tax=Croceitalea rosinachiae TaxID=3075596 RepID=A0ABU3A8T3_9FLAO|nr:PHB depolymerase family esterase [Croceitalea sp. F388]MDT0606215.1 PHB depolymerase family esterase [Croceitalea sp. F388]